MWRDRLFRLQVRLRRLVPPAGKRAGKAVLAAVDPVARAVARRSSPGPVVVPPYRLRSTVGGQGARKYARSGVVAVDEIERALASIGDGTTRRPRSVLDLGCGPGRVLFHAEARFGHGRVRGCDVDRRAIEWARGVRPDVFFHNDFSPPLPFTDGEFDLVYAISVFTHLPEASQELWLAEVARVLAPDGVALLSFHGPYYYAYMRGGSASGVRAGMLRQLREAPDLGPGDFRYFSYSAEGVDPQNPLRDQGDYGLSFQGHEYVRRRWSRHLEVLAIHPEAINYRQDLVVASLSNLSASA